MDEQLNDFFIKGKGNILSCLRQLYTLSKDDPFKILESLGRAVKNKKFSMIPIGLAVLFGRSSEVWLTQNAKEIQLVLSKLTADEIICMVDFLKEKDFGRGLGSRPQRAVKAVMEGWSDQEVTIFCKESPSELLRLCNLIHPIFVGTKAAAIRRLTAK